jgi:hypothetical protein
LEHTGDHESRPFVWASGSPLTKEARRQTGKREKLKALSRLRLQTHLIVIATDDVHISCDGPQIVVRFTVANIAGAKYLLNFSWNEKFLELGGEVVDSMGDMKITDDEDEDHVGGELKR